MQSAPTKPVFTGQWESFSLFDRQALSSLLATAARPSCRFCEIGSWLGAGSTQEFMKVLRETPGAELYCVDTWMGSPNVEKHKDLVNNFDVFLSFKNNTRDCPDIIPVRKTSIEAAKQFDDEFFDLIFIDADHSYSSVSADIAAWLPKVKRGGVLCGHDAEERITDENSQLFAMHREDDVIARPGRSIPVVHPGCIKAVHEAFGGKANLFTEQQPYTLATGQQGRSTIWHVTKPRGWFDWRRYFPPKQVASHASPIEGQAYR